METITATYCSWFLGCQRTPSYLVAHSILGEVATCSKCVEALDLWDNVTATLQPECAHNWEYLDEPYAETMRCTECGDTQR